MSRRGPQSKTGPAAMPAPHRTTYLADVGRSLRGAAGQAWMVTFADLVALLLAFFVLLFAMSIVERYKWQNLIRSLAGNMDSLESREGPKPAIEFQIEQLRPAPGTDLDYLTPVVERQLAAAPELAEAILWRRGGETVLSLPAESLFEAGTAEIAPGARATVYALSRVIQTLDNRIEIQGQGGEAETAWGGSLARAAALAAGLAEAGYGKGLAARGRGPARDGAPAPPLRRGDAARFAERIDVVIFEDAS